MIETKAPSPTHCPQCDSDRIVPVVYGKPSQAMIEGQERGEIMLGAGGMYVGCPNRGCALCRYKWFDERVRLQSLARIVKNVAQKV